MGRERAKELLWHYLKSVEEVEPHSADSRREIEAIVDEICDAVHAELEPRVLKIERGLNSTANTASCLANGIIPD